MSMLVAELLRSARRPLTSPVVPLALLTAAGIILLAAGRQPAGLCAVAAVAGVALSGST